MYVCTALVRCRKTLLVGECGCGNVGAERLQPLFTERCTRLCPPAGAPNGNQLWEFDGWEWGGNGGIYHENMPDTPWGRAFAFWKGEVVDMLEGVCGGE